MQIAWMVLSRPLEANHRRGCKIVTNLRHLWGRMSDVDDNPFFRVFMHEYLWIRKLHREKKRSSVKKLHSSSDCWMAKKASTMHAEKLIKLSSFHPPTSIPQSRTIQLFIICMLAFHKHALPITVLANNREEKFIWKSFALARRVKEVEAEIAGKNGRKKFSRREHNKKSRRMRKINNWQWQKEEIKKSLRDEAAKSMGKANVSRFLLPCDRQASTLVVLYNADVPRVSGMVLLVFWLSEHDETIHTTLVMPALTRYIKW